MAGSTAKAAGLHLTGERTVPGVAEENYWFARHEAAYEYLLPRCVGAAVLEAGCGEGYGAARIAAHAQRVIALDYDEPATTHLASRYRTVDAVRANLAALPIRASSMDLVVNLQVIEHLWDQGQFLGECARVLRRGGTLILSTPNRLTFSPGRDTPLNPYHTRELSPDELLELLGEQGFEVTELVGLRHGPALRALDAAYGGSIIDAQLDVVRHHLPGQAVWPRVLLADIAAIRAADFEFDPADLDTSLDLLAVAVLP